MLVKNKKRKKKKANVKSGLKHNRKTCHIVNTLYKMYLLVEKLKKYPNRNLSETVPVYYFLKHCWNGRGSFKSAQEFYGLVQCTLKWM